jgi:3-deoxy-D-manno-octulosonic-acid transferase
MKKRKFNLVGWLIFIIYNIAWLIFLPFLAIFVLIKSVINPRRYFDSYLRKLTIKLPQPIETKTIWIHCVSGGEASVGSEIAKEMLRKEAELHIVLTTHTIDGMDMAKKKLKGSNVKLEYLPYDSYLLMSRFVRRINPELLLILETEIWPNLVITASFVDVPILMVNGRIYEKDFNTYLLFKSLIKPTLSQYSKFYTQSVEDAYRLVKIGVSEDKVEYLGNIKFNVRLNPEQQIKTEQIRQSIKDYSKYRYVMLPSTHKGEEELLLNAYLNIREEFKDLRIILAPRNLNRIGEIERLLDTKGIPYTLFSKTNQYDKTLLLVDTFGELMSLYPLSHLVIMGGTFSKSVGGHNILEPALFGIPICVGLYNQNFKDIVNSFIKNDAIKTISDHTPKSVASVIREYYTHLDDYNRMGERGKQIVESQKHIIKDTVNRVLQHKKIDTLKCYLF